MKSKLLKIILVIAIIVFVAVGYLFLTGKIGQKKEVKEESVNSAVSSVETSDWKTYKNEKYGFELDFLESWKGYKLTIKEYPQWTEMCFAIAGKGERSYCILQIVVYTKEQWASFKEKYPNAKNAKEDNQNSKYIFKYGYTTDNSSYEECESVQLSKFQCDRSREVPQILSSFKFIDNSILSIDNFKKIRDFAKINDIGKNPNRDFVIVSGFEIESYGDYKPFDIVSIEGFFGGTYYKYSFDTDNGGVGRILRNPDSRGIFTDSSVDLSENDTAKMREIVKAVLDGIDNQKLSEINKWKTHKSDYGFEFKYPQEYAPLRDLEADDIALILVPASIGERNIKIASSPNDPNPSGKFFQSEIPYMRIRAIKGIYSTRKLAKHSQK